MFDTIIQYVVYILLSILGVFFTIDIISLITKSINRSAFLWKDKHVIITGGSKGLGKDIAIEVAKLGGNVTIMSR